ncbi:MAG: trypsin-like peptidase domain-containing protein [Planctomycetota bacterium]
MRTLLFFSLVLFGPLAGPGPAQEELSDETVLKEAEKVERSMIRLVEKLRQSTVAVIRYEEKEINGETVEVESGQGSGVIVSRDGKVFTNVHVIAQASRIVVILPGGEPVEAELFSSMPLYDFALLRVRSAGLLPADFAKTSNVRPGQWAVAAGNPRGLGADGQPIATLGIVSGMGRVAGGTYRYDNAIQTDAEINPGNSGGPLFDLDGRVIGINGLISTLNNERISVGVGYTIPADQIQRFLPQLIAGDVVEPGYSGLVIEQKTDKEGGVLIRNVVRGSPASKVGLRQGDRIVGVNGTRIETYTSWANAVAMLPSGKSMSVRYVRGGRTSLRTFTLAEARRSETP